jgi:hypothetical protein
MRCTSAWALLRRRWANFGLKGVKRYVSPLCSGFIDTLCRVICDEFVCVYFRLEIQERASAAGVNWSVGQRTLCRIYHGASQLQLGIDPLVPATEKRTLYLP